MSMTEDEIHSIAERAGKKAAQAVIDEVTRKTFLGLGIDISDPEAVIELQADRQWTRRTRRSAEETGRHIKKVGVGAITLLVLTIFGIGLRAWFKQQGGDLP